MRNGSTKLFNVYKHPSQGLRAVKVGFSWPAFFVTVIWAIVYRLWGLVVVWIALYAVVSVSEGFIETLDDSTLKDLLILTCFSGWLALCLVPGFKGNSWREKNLVKKSYELINSVQAQSGDDAISKTKLSLKDDLTTVETLK